MGTTVGNRVVGADVLTVRYVDSVGGLGAWSAARARPGSSRGQCADHVTLVPACRRAAAQQLRQRRSGACWPIAPTRRFLPPTTWRVATSRPMPNNLGTPGAAAAVVGAAAVRPQQRLQDGDLLPRSGRQRQGNGHTTGALIRRVNGVRSSELVRGSSGWTSATACRMPMAIRASSPPTRSMPSPVRLPAGPPNPLSAADPGCMWRAVSSIEVDILMDGQIPLYTLTPERTCSIRMPRIATTAHARAGCACAQAL